MAIDYFNNRNEKTTSLAVSSLQEKVNSTFSTLSVAAHRQVNLATGLAKKYDEKYEKESEATLAGIFFLVVPILFSVFCVLNFEKNGGFDRFVQVMSVGAVFVRFIATKWISSIAADQNRSTANWMAFSFFFPAISLIVIGQTKKLLQAEVTKQAGITYNAKARFQRFLHIRQNEGLQMAS